MSYAAAAVGRGFVKGGVSRLLQPVVTVWVMGVWDIKINAQLSFLKNNLILAIAVEM